MIFNQKRPAENLHGFFQRHDSLLLFFFFLLGSVSVLLGRHIVPWIVREAEARLSILYLIAPILLALLAGSTIWGLYLIPASAFVQGALVAVCVYRSFPVYSLRSLPVPELCSTAIAIPAFFLIGALGLSNASALLFALRLSGKSAERAAIQSFAARWLIFAVLLLCFFFLHGTLNR